MATERGGITRLRWAATLALLLFSAGGGTATADPAGHRPRPPLWVQRLNEDITDYGRSIAIAPDGSAVYVTGDAGTVAYDAATGAQLWAVLLESSAVGESLQVGLDGARVFVTGVGGYPNTYYVTEALDAATGGEVWAQFHYGIAPGPTSPTDLRLSPDGARVFVTGSSYSGPNGVSFGTVAYDAATGTELWVATYGDDVCCSDFVKDLGVSPDGARVFVTGSSDKGLDNFYATTVGYDAATGTQLWVSHYRGPMGGSEGGNALALTPDGASVFVTGQSAGVSGYLDYVTIAYDAVTGLQRWVSRYDGPSSEEDAASAIGVSLDGTMVYVTGASASDTADDYATIAYMANSGAMVWLSRYNGSADLFDNANALAVSPNGATVYVTGGAYAENGYPDYVTVAYRSRTGRQLWVGRYNGMANSVDEAYGLVVSPDAARVYVTGVSVGVQSSYDYATLAYPS